MYLLGICVFDFSPFFSLSRPFLVKGLESFVYVHFVSFSSSGCFSFLRMTICGLLAIFGRCGGLGFVDAANKVLRYLPGSPLDGALTYVIYTCCSISKGVIWRIYFLVSIFPFFETEFFKCFVWFAFFILGALLALLIFGILIALLKLSAPMVLLIFGALVALLILIVFPASLTCALPPRCLSHLLIHPCLHPKSLPIYIFFFYTSDDILTDNSPLKPSPTQASDGTLFDRLCEPFFKRHPDRQSSQNECRKSANHPKIMP